MKQALYPTAQELMAQAQAEAGLSDFGPPAIAPGLERLLQCLAEGANLTAEGRAFVIPSLVRRLVMRLKIEQWWNAHPETANLPIAGPISIIGLPRTGTTALASMMSLDPQFRCLRMWEQRDPCPPPTLETEKQDPRRLAYARSLEELFVQQPEQKVMHLYEVDATVEDTEILGLTFMAQNATYPVFGYYQWWRDADMRPAYAYQRRIAQILQSRRPPNLWLFKAPHHKFHLEAFVHAYPDVRFIFTHRDPAKSVPSYASFVMSLYPPGSAANTDPRKVGQQIHQHLLTGMHRAMEARKRLGEHRFFDVHHRAMDADPLGTLEGIYRFLGYEFRPEVRATIKAWSDANRSGAHGVHRYTPEHFGLTADQIRSDYDFYLRHFGTAVER